VRRAHGSEHRAVAARSRHRSSATPLAGVYAALVVYASLYPFADWRYQGIMPWAFLASPLPRYWSGFDVAVNVLGYMPLGFLLALSALRSGRQAFTAAMAMLPAGSFDTSAAATCLSTQAV
jgi:VanZ family protein